MRTSDPLKYIGNRYGSLVLKTFIRRIYLKGLAHDKEYEALCDCGETRTLRLSNVLRKRNPAYCCNKCLTRVAIESMPMKCYNAVKWCGEKRSYYFDISFKDWLKLSQESCYYCGSNNKNKYTVNSKRAKPFFYMGLDRVNNDKGYSVDNCVPCCITCNRAKGTTPKANFLNWVKDVYNFQYAKTQNNSL